MQFSRLHAAKSQLSLRPVGRDVYEGCHDLAREFNFQFHLKTLYYLNLYYFGIYSVITYVPEKRFFLN